jgi:thioredoxin reductase (NADPH)
MNTSFEKPDYDLVIIGGGPAGLTAGIYACRARLKTVLLEKIVPGGQALISDFIENYPGFPQGISGPELVFNMTQQAKNFGLNIESEEVFSIDFSEPIKRITIEEGKTITAASVIIATGASPKKLNIPGEKEFIGKGISSCATCDAPFYKDKIVAAVGGGDTAVQESIFLTKFAKKVFLIHRRDELRAAKILIEKALENEKIEIVWDSVLEEIKGTSRVEKAVIKNVKTNKTKEIVADGCFIWVGIDPNNQFLDKNQIKMDEYGFIITNQQMMTSCKGVFAVGDVRSTPLRQIATAVGDASIAAVLAEHYIESFYV